MNNFSSSSTRYPTFVRSPQANAASRRVVSSRRAGFTVLEVLIALVVLLIGGLAIMNLFPPALNVIRGSENREVAMSQVKGTLARLNAEPATIPDAIYDRAGGGWNDLPETSVEGSRNRNKSLPKTVSATDSALDHFKHIVGERHKVLTDGTNRFVLLNYAYIGTPDIRIIDKIEGVRVNDIGVLDFSDARIASNNNVASPMRGTDYRYYVSYNWQIALNAPLQGVTDEPLDLPLPPPPYLDRVFRISNVIAGPVELKLRTNVLGIPGPIDSGDSLRGRLAVGNNVNVGQEVVIDYDVSDWRWMIEDVSATIPNPGNAAYRDVKLTVPDLNSTPGTWLYGLVYQVPSDYNVRVPVAVGTPSPGSWTGTAGTGSVTDVNRTAIVYNPGTITTPFVRTSYQATHGWSQQLSVAARSYYDFNPLRSVSEPWREFYWQPLSDAASLGTSSNIMYFHASEAGKTIMVSFSNGANKTTDQIMTIGTKLVSAPALVSASGFVAPSGKVAAVNFTEKTDGSPASADAIQSVRGVSVRARAAWVQNGEYTQEIAEMYRPLN